MMPFHNHSFEEGTERIIIIIIIISFEEVTERIIIIIIITS